MAKLKKENYELLLAGTVRTNLEGLYIPLKKMLAGILKDHSIWRASLSVSFVGRNRIRALNRDYLQHDRITDVISFNLSGGGRSDALTGDIYICLEQARRQAEQYKVPLAEELFRLSAHGALHLLGFDHSEAEPARQMNNLQEHYVSSYAAQIAEINL